MLTGTISKLSEDITELSEGIATIDKAVAEATADREAEKAKNTETIADAEAASLTQMKGPAEDAPETFDGAYKGNQDQASGVMGMLEVIQSDFARLESETTAGEAEAADVFQKYSSDSATNKAVKETDVKHKTSKKQETESSLAEAKKDLAATHEELSAAMDYY